MVLNAGALLSRGSAGRVVRMNTAQQACGLPGETFVSTDVDGHPEDPGISPVPASFALRGTI